MADPERSGMTPVKSSNIHSVGYDEQSCVLTVRFLNGATHAYAGVPAEDHRKLMDADSVGSHFHRHILGTFKSSKVDQPA